MNLESQVCSLELSKHLKELGVKQDSLFYWRDHSEKDKCASIVYTKGKIIDNDQYSAFTVAELGEMLKSSRKLPYVDYTDSGFKWKIDDGATKNFDYKVYGKAIDFYFSDAEADARAKTLIYLIKNNLNNFKSILIDKQEPL